MEQQYILKNCKSFELKDIFECGQCFRWNPNKDESYTGVFGNNVINVSKKEMETYFLKEYVRAIYKQFVKSILI